MHGQILVMSISPFRRSVTLDPDSPDLGTRDRNHRIQGHPYITQFPTVGVVVGVNGDRIGGIVQGELLCDAHFHAQVNGGGGVIQKIGLDTYSLRMRVDAVNRDAAINARSKTSFFISAFKSYKL